MDRESFAQYVVGSKAEHTWLLLHKNAEGDIVGYFALHLFEKHFDGAPLAMFRAEAGSLRAYRGGNINARFWMERVVRYVMRHPGRRVFYMGALVHPSSYSLHCGEVWPRHGQETPPALLSLMASLASEFGLEQVDPARPLVRRVGWSTREPDVERETLVGRLSACEALKEVNPGKTAELLRGLEAAMAMERAAKKAQGKQAAEDAETLADAPPEPPDCKGQDHHIISRPIAKKLEGHLTLAGFYKPRDKHFVAKAKDESSHCGYQEWHRKVDKEVIDWLDKHPQATPEQFMRFLRESYKRPDMLKRFPRGF